MATYSFTSNQLAKRTQPKKPFWSGNKIAVAVACSSITLFGLAVAGSPSAPSASVAEVKKVVVKETPVEVTPKKSASEIYEEVRAMCANAGPWTYDVTQCEENETKARVKAEPQPIPDAKWNAQEQTWICPTSVYAETYYNCSKGNVISKAEFDRNTKIEACVGRANKEEGSLGESWAFGQCRQNTNAF